MLIACGQDVADDIKGTFLYVFIWLFDVGDFC